MLKRTKMAGAGFATALCLTLATPAQSGVIQMLVDNNKVEFVSTISFFNGDTIIKNLIAASVDHANTTDENIVYASQGIGVGTLADGGTASGQFTYQLIFDENPLTGSANITVTGGNMGAVKGIQTAATNGIFRMFWSPDYNITGGDANDKTGSCFGNLGGDPLCGGQVVLLEGTVSMQAGGILYAENTSVPITLLDTANDTNLYGNVGSASIGGSGTLTIDIFAQADIVLNTFVDPQKKEVSVSVFAADAPYGDGSDVVPTKSVVGEVAYFGADENFTVGTTTYLAPVNEFGCNDTTGFCDVQLQTSGLFSFAPERVAEPAPLMLAGLSLGLVAWISRRRYRRKPGNTGL